MNQSVPRGTEKQGTTFPSLSTAEHPDSCSARIRCWPDMRKGGQVFFPDLPLALTLPSQFPSHLAPPLAEKTDGHCGFNASDLPHDPSNLRILASLPGADSN